MTPDLPDHPTDLTPLQRVYLARLRRFAERPPSRAMLWAAQGPRVALLTVLFLLPAAAAWHLESWWMMGFCCGTFGGVMLQVSVNIRYATRVWPATAAVVDWRRLDRLTGEHDSHP